MRAETRLATFVSPVRRRGQTLVVRVRNFALSDPLGLIFVTTATRNLISRRRREAQRLRCAMVPALTTAAGIVLVTMPALVCGFLACQRRPFAEIWPLLPSQTAATIYLSVSTAKQPLTWALSDLKWALQALAGLLILFFRIAWILYPGLGGRSPDHLRNSSDDEENHWTSSASRGTPSRALAAVGKNWKRQDSPGDFATPGRTVSYHDGPNDASLSSGGTSDSRPMDPRHSAFDASETVPRMTITAWATSLFS